MKWEGVPELRAKLNAVAMALDEEGKGNARERMKDVLMPAALTLRDEAKDLAPVRSGALKNAIFATKGSERLPGVLVGVNRDEAFYAHMVENGTSKMAAQPFFRPAIAATRPLVANMIAEGMKKLLAEITR